jgi:adenylosuccinate synthase
MAIRTFPIRVGNVDGYSSGDWYPDQHEVSWEEIERAPELTTVTQRVRRIATFSMIQFIDACYANMPDLVYVSHMDYLNKPDQVLFKEAMIDTKKMMDMEYMLMYSGGPKVADVELGATFGGLLCQ